MLQINYGTRTLERVYQLHSAAINCMLVSDGLCVTGSDDKYLRVWPLDFSDFLLEVSASTRRSIAVTVIISCVVTEDVCYWVAALASSVSMGKCTVWYFYGLWMGPCGVSQAQYKTPLTARHKLPGPPHCLNSEVL